MKNKLKALIILFFLTALSSSSCQKEEVVQSCEGDNASQIETFYNEEFDENPCSLQNISADEEVLNLVIKTQVDYEKHFTCSNQLPPVDFEKYFILAGRYRHIQCAILDNQQVLMCDNKLFYKVRMLLQDCQAITNVFYVKVVEKKYENLPVAFDVKFSN
jgi:hypothetical protein